MEPSLKRAPRMSRHQRDNCVTDDLESVHPSGMPISHSAHGGFGVPPSALPKVSFWTFPFRMTCAVLSL